MRITNSKHVPWFIFVCLASAAAVWLYVGNFHPEGLSPALQLPESLRQTPSEHHSIGGTPLGLWFGSISLAIFVFAALLSLRKKIPLWRIGTVQRWLRAHIWLTLLTIPLVILHSGFRLGGPMTMLLMALYAIVMLSGIYGLVLQHHLPRLMKERLPAETVFEQIPHIRAQLYAAAEKMRDSFKPAPPKKMDAGAPAASPAKSATATSAAMGATSGAGATPVARAKTTTGSDATAAPVSAVASVSSAAPVAKATVLPAATAANAAAPAAPAKTAETIGTPTARVQSEPPGAAVARAAIPPGDEAAPSPPVAPAVAASPPKTAATPAAPAKPAAPPKPAAAAKPPPPPTDPVSEAALIEFIERQVLPYLGAKSGKRYRLGKARFADETFRFVKIRVSETYRSRVEEIQGWCDERRMLDLQTRMQHWLHGWLFVHVPFSFLLLMLTIWHAVVTLFVY
ncbi:MAG: hypothetical protein M3Z64_06705 [Verrucomicrobiota bacterium]|nr:hypothetical protein [Verrucomicrobiota bacterium]